MKSSSTFNSSARLIALTLAVLVVAFLLGQTLLAALNLPPRPLFRPHPILHAVPRARGVPQWALGCRCVAVAHTFAPA